MMQLLQNYVWTSELVRAVVTKGNISETSFVFFVHMKHTLTHACNERIH
jgi:hypothetical protein